MKVTVFGANGNVGRKVVAKLLDDGHIVVACVHSASRLPANPVLHVVQGDIHDPQFVASAMQDSDAVVSTLGSWNTASKDILSAAMRTVIPTMEHIGIRRIVSLTGAGASDSTDNPNAFDRLGRNMLGLVAPQILRDGEEHIALLRGSQLSWTVIRSPIMTDGRGRGYRLDNSAPYPWETISRADVAAAMVEQIQDTAYYRQSPFIRRQRRQEP